MPMTTYWPPPVRLEGLLGVTCSITCQLTALYPTSGGPMRWLLVVVVDVAVAFVFVISV